MSTIPARHGPTKGFPAPAASLSDETDDAERAAVGTSTRGLRSAAALILLAEAGRFHRTLPGDHGASGRRRASPDVVRAVASGPNNAEIAGELFVPTATVKTHLMNAQQKLATRTRVEITFWVWVCKRGPVARLERSAGQLGGPGAHWRRRRSTRVRQVRGPIAALPVSPWIHRYTPTNLPRRATRHVHVAITTPAQALRSPHWSSSASRRVAAACSRADKESRRRPVDAHRCIREVFHITVSEAAETGDDLTGVRHTRKRWTPGTARRCFSPSPPRRCGSEGRCNARRRLLAHHPLPVPRCCPNVAAPSGPCRAGQRPPAAAEPPHPPPPRQRPPR